MRPSFEKKNERNDHRSHMRQPGEKRLALFRVIDPQDSECDVEPEKNPKGSNAVLLVEEKQECNYYNHHTEQAGQDRFIVFGMLLADGRENPVQGKGDPKGCNHVFLENMAHGWISFADNAPSYKRE